MSAEATTSQAKTSLRISRDTWAVVVALLAAPTKSIRAGSQASFRSNSQNSSRLLETQNAYQFPDR